MYTIICDASIEPVNPGGLIAWAYVVKDKTGTFFQKNGYSPFSPENTNNMGEYHAIIAALLWLIKLPKKEQIPATIKSDSQLVINQLTGDFQTRTEKLIKLRDIALKAVSRYNSDIKFMWVSRNQTLEADELSREIYNIPDIKEELLKYKKDPLYKIFGNDDIPF